jgi:aryl-alcohol dehydrogenase-like predicted oxidoreductase
MRYRQLGHSGLRVSTLTMGTMTFGGKAGIAAIGQTEVEEAGRQIDQFLAAGGNLIDTANMYSHGVSEEYVGKAIAGKRDSVLLATKVRFAMGRGPNDVGLSRHHIISQAEASLTRLGVDHIDLYQLHEWDGVTPLEETLAALDHLVSSGKVRYVGASNYSGWHLLKALGLSDRYGWPRFVSEQIHYTLQCREAEYELVPAAVDQGLGILVWSPLAGGLLSGKYRRDTKPSEGRHLGDWSEPPIASEDDLYDIVDVLVEIGAAHSVSAAQVAIAWLLTRPAVSSVIVGARTSEQLADNLAAADLDLTDDEIARLEKVSRPRLLYPYWHQRNIAQADRSASPDSFHRLGEADLALIGPYLD